MREFLLGPAARVLLELAALAAVAASGLVTGVYSRIYSAGNPSPVRDTARQAVVAVLPLLAVLYLLNLEVPVSRLFLALFFAYLTALQIAQRAVAVRFRGSLRRALGDVASVVLVGDGKRTLRIGQELEKHEQQGLRLLAIVDCGTCMGTEANLRRRYPVHAVSTMARVLVEHPVDVVLFAVSSEQLRSLESVFALCDEHGVRTQVVADFLPLAHSRVHFDRLGDRPLLTFSVAPHDDIRLAAKRGLDAALAALSLAALSVPMMIVALLIRATSKGPALFRQERCGLNGRIFTCYKFRSMVEDAESRRKEVEHLNEKDGPAFKMRADPRVTPLGRFLRRFSIDEWPQFWNVLRGEMSIVGPRPAVPSEVGRYETWQRRRLRMRPGLTCLWAIRGRDRVDFESWMEMDLEYINTWSLALDMKILALTVPTVISGRGAS